MNQLPRVRRRRLLPAIVMAAALVATTAVSTAAAPSQSDNGQVHETVKAANWKSCFDEVEAEFADLPPFLGGPPTISCATVKVPLDYDAPSKGVIDIDLVRLEANDPDNKIGSLFLNPGGPGGSGIEFALFGAPFLFGPEVRAQFDIVGFDPRGVARGTPARCYGNERQQGSVLSGLAFPTNEAELEVWLASDKAFADQCDKRGNRVIGHMSTGNVARDLDVLRQAVGDDQLTYYGISYGTQIGQTYVNMFPENVRAVVIDGVLDAEAWTDGAPGDQHLPVSSRLRSAEGAQDTLNEFFRLCDEAGPEACAFAPDSAERYRVLADTMLANDPVFLKLEVGPGQVVEVPLLYGDLIGMTLGAMYSSFTWPFLAQDLALFEAQFVNGSDEPLVIWDPNGPPPEEPPPPPKKLFPRYYNWLEAFPSVFCADGKNPDSIDAWIDAAGPLPGDNYFQPLWTWASSVCLEYDAAADDDRYAGPWDADTENPVLIMSTFYDPATPVHGAYLAHDRLQNSGLILVDGWGHGALGISACADFFRNHYLLTTELLFEDQIVCPQDFGPFDFFGGGFGFDARQRMLPVTGIAR